MNDKRTSLILEALDKRWNDYHAILKLCRREATKEAVHDLRVATRRLITLIELLRVLAPHPRLQKLHKDFKDQLDSFEGLRDTQVMVVEISEALEELPQAEPFLRYLMKREKRLLGVAGKQIHQTKPGNLIKRVSAVRKSMVKLSASQAELDRLVLDTVDDAFSLVMHRVGLLDRAQPPTVHRLRIVFRKFRYLMEIVHPIVSDYPADNLARMHEFQGWMGDIQDIEILLSCLGEFVEKEPAFDPLPVSQYFEERHAEAIDLFFQNAAKVKSFWRASPTARFPWNRPPRRKAPPKPAPGILPGEMLPGPASPPMVPEKGGTT
ncbi:MAG TPA: CHAD domain-containing protein [Anaerolineales bacterium]|nr:CHAD domain-containing protein [Anaerolineales bacterium]